MITIKTNSVAFGKQIDAEIAGIDLMLNGVLRGLAVSAFEILLQETPQWSGNAAANWNFGIGSPDLSVHHTFRQKLEQANIPAQLEASVIAKQKGHAEAIDHAIRRNIGKELAVTLGVPVHISNNATDLSGESYITMLESNPNGFLRPENDPGHMVQTAFQFVSQFVNMSSAQVKLLVSKRIGDSLGDPLQLGLF